MSLNKLIKDFFYDVKGYVPTFIEILRVNLGLRKLLEQKIGNNVLSKFKLQARLFMGFFSVVPKSTISLTIAGIVISRHQEGIIQSSYFCYSSKLLKNVWKDSFLVKLQIVLKLENLLIYLKLISCQKLIKDFDHSPLLNNLGEWVQ